MRVGRRPIPAPVTGHPFGKAGLGKGRGVTRWHEPGHGNPHGAETRFRGCDDLGMHAWYPGEGDTACREFGK